MMQYLKNEIIKCMLTTVES